MKNKLVIIILTIMCIISTSLCIKFGTDAMKNDKYIRNELNTYWDSIAASEYNAYSQYVDNLNEDEEKMYSEAYSRGYDDAKNEGYDAFEAGRYEAKEEYDNKLSTIETIFSFVAILLFLAFGIYEIFIKK